MKFYQQAIRSVFTIDFVAVVAMLASCFFPLTWPVDMPGIFWVKQTFEYFLYFTFYFGNVYFLYPKLANKKFGFLYFLIVCGTVYLIPVVLRFVRNILELNEALVKVYSTAGHPYRPSDHWDTTIVIAISLVVLTLSYISAVAKKMQKNQLAFEDSERERVVAELSFLKAQINPHFFFNTLHTIYALMDTDQPAAKSSIYNLSHMMRYVLYDTKSDKTSLKKEISFIEDYIALMKVRISDKVQVIFDKQQNMPELEIVPMLFLPFIENAFKHGISAVNPSYVYIGISMSDDELKFEVRNSLFEDLGKQLDDDKGIGLTNTRRRLDLLYPGKYTLNIDSDLTEKEYSIVLTIQK
ncbi:MAG: sensor histidine kinase [Bacteroidota bacterium]